MIDVAEQCLAKRLLLFCPKESFNTKFSGFLESWIVPSLMMLTPAIFCTITERSFGNSWEDRFLRFEFFSTDQQRRNQRGLIRGLKLRPPSPPLAIQLKQYKQCQKMSLFLRKTAKTFSFWRFHLQISVYDVYHSLFLSLKLIFTSPQKIFKSRNLDFIEVKSKLLSENNPPLTVQFYAKLFYSAFFPRFRIYSGWLM